jgi:hypothetical protein
MNRWPHLTVLELWWIVYLTTALIHLQQPAAVAPPIVPGR